MKVKMCWAAVSFPKTCPVNSKLLKFLLVAGLAAFVSCQDETLEPAPFCYEYYPVEIGRYVVYDVDSVFHSDNDNNNDDSVYTWHFQVKEKIDSTFIDGQGRTAQRILRYRRLDTTAAWTFMNVWTQ